MGVDEARGFFLEKIQQELADEGQPMSSFESRYWKALAPPSEPEVEALWKQKNLRKDLDAAEKRFQNALREAIHRDLSFDPTARERYLTALDEIKSLEGIQLQAIVFAAAMDFEELMPSSPFMKWLIPAAILILFALGMYFGSFFKR